MNNEILDVFYDGNRQEIINIINNNQDIINDIGKMYYFIHMDIEILKFIFEYCEKINKKIYFDGVVVCGIFILNDAWKYIHYLIKHNYNIIPCKKKCF